MLVVASDEHRHHHPRDPHLFGGRLLEPREVPARAEVVLAALQEAGLADVAPPSPLDRSLLEDVHAPAYLAVLESAHARWSALTGVADGEALPFVRPYLEHDFATPEHVLAQLGRYSHDADPVLRGTWRAACAAAACAVTAMRAVLDGAPAAYALCRPPGHHAARASFGGYCYLNNVALAAATARRAGVRVATLDIDAHAGNGTQTIFWERADVLCVSLHVDPAVEYPYFQGHRTERGAGAGAGYTRNLPMGPGTGWPQYAAVLDSACEAVAGYGIDVLAVALGVDTAVEDGVLALAGDDYRRLGARIAALRVPTVLVQEGGYDLGVLGRNVAAVVEGFEQGA